MEKSDAREIPLQESMQMMLFEMSKNAVLPRIDDCVVVFSVLSVEMKKHTVVVFLVQTIREI